MSVNAGKEVVPDFLYFIILPPPSTNILKNLVPSASMFDGVIESTRVAVSIEMSALVIGVIASTQGN